MARWLYFSDVCLASPHHVATLPAAATRFAYHRPFSQAHVLFPRQARTVVISNDSSDCNRKGATRA
ncbi:hypothetical protein SODALDRAFT_362723 [Sodiomyces alkalinus F11]|uniref:Uncharacterized protein n=1 Tax=Sodiomyces alkalinus (strain CBS 110278 / VKM F-3762 / F11) TaxID=1314773 RepID=A0A3N2PN71_SODAK|nr:hypothetical protein SODALDRAFT_362723 [Sodiomyces alkalinus F11]ROT35874.1 hypothetical protein SODALDRAFT_362723 [Sodiomyces alkalinus F11]